MVSDSPSIVEPTSPTHSSSSTRPQDPNDKDLPSAAAAASRHSAIDIYDSDGPVSYSTEALLRQSHSESQEMRSSPLPPHDNGFNQEKEKELPRLQANGHRDDGDQLDPVLDDDPSSYNLVAPPPAGDREPFSLETQTSALFSKGHLQVIFGDPTFLFKFTSFLGLHRPQSVPILVHYLDSLKSLRAIHYANAICEGLDPVEGLEFTQKPVKLTINTFLEERARKAFDVLVTEELPAFITHHYIQIVSASIIARVTGVLSPQLREASDGLAEVFCLTDPSRSDNPIVFASEGRSTPIQLLIAAGLVSKLYTEFNRTTQYGMNYILGRNCRFLQGPMTNPNSVRRLRDAIKAGKQHQEVFLN